MNQFFQLLEAVLRFSPELSHNLEVSYVDETGELLSFRPVLEKEKVKVKCKGKVSDFLKLPGICQVNMIEKLTEIAA